jgi:hypothetical protein
MRRELVNVLNRPGHLKEAPGWLRGLPNRVTTATSDWRTQKTNSSTKINASTALDNDRAGSFSWINYFWAAISPATVENLVINAAANRTG